MPQFSLRYCALLVMLLATSQLAEAAVVTIPPGLHPGDQYRLAFVTTAKTSANSSDVSYYNSFVTTAANSNSVLAALGTTWTAIATVGISGPNSISAIQNTGTDPSSVGLPIFNLDGELVAANYQILWGNSSTGGSSPSIDVTENGTIYSGGVWSGTSATGTAISGYYPLGVQNSFIFNYKSTIGNSTKGPLTAFQWIAPDMSGNLAALNLKSVDNTYPLYALSGVITVVPEVNPAILAGLAIGGAMMTRHALRGQLGH